MDIFEDFKENGLVLLKLSEEEYSREICGVLRDIERKNGKICYLCLSRPYADVASDLRKWGIKADVLFIDVLSSHYRSQKPRRDCIFLESPESIDAMLGAINDAVKKGACKTVIFDSISSLLAYHDASSIVRLAHRLTTEEYEKEAKKLLILTDTGDFPEKDNVTLASDLQMFADNSLEIK